MMISIKLSFELAKLLPLMHDASSRNGSTLDANNVTILHICEESILISVRAHFASLPVR
jgi:hypothetical protein